MYDEERDGRKKRRDGERRGHAVGLGVRMTWGEAEQGRPVLSGEAHFWQSKEDEPTTRERIQQHLSLTSHTLTVTEKAYNMKGQRHNKNHKLFPAQLSVCSVCVRECVVASLFRQATGCVCCKERERLVQKSALQMLMAAADATSSAFLIVFLPLLLLAASCFSRLSLSLSLSLSYRK